MRFGFLSKVVVLLLAGAAMAGCTAPQVMSESASDVVSRLGKVPIPNVSTGKPVPVSADVGHPQLLVIGAPVDVWLPDGVHALITATGPTEESLASETGPERSIHGVITVVVTVSAGTMQLIAGDFASRGQNGDVVSLASSGPATASVAAGQSGSLSLFGTFHAGAAQINWRPNGHVIAMWDFNVEAD